MHANLLVLERLQAIAGTPGVVHSVFNASLPVLLPEYEKIRRVAEICGAITDSIKDIEGTSILVSAVADVRQQCDESLLALKQKICKEGSDGFDDADRHAYLRSDKKTQAEFESIAAGDHYLLAWRKKEAAELQAGQSPPK